jgi:hypothetical protein
MEDSVGVRVWAGAGKAAARRRVTAKRKDMMGEVITRGEQVNEMAMGWIARGYRREMRVAWW